MILNDFVPMTFRRETVPADELQKGGEILIQEMNAEQAMKFNALCIAMNQDPEVSTKFVYFMACMVASTMIREDGELLVNPDHYKELPKQLGEKLLSRIYNKAAAMNGFTPELPEQAKKP